MFHGSSVRVMLLVLVLCAFSLYAAVTYERHMSFSQNLTLTLKSGAWSASELDGELSKFMHALELFQLGKVSPDEVQLRFDLMWSRLDMLLVGQETQETRELPGAADLLGRVETALMQTESNVGVLQQGEVEAAKAIQAHFSPLQSEVRDFSVRAFNGPRRLDTLREAKVQQERFGYFLVALLVIGFLLLFIVLRETARGRRTAFYDPLTGLPNRSHFNEYLKAAEKRYQKDGNGFAVHVLDLNDFKNINDVLGYSAGDRLLVEIAGRLSGAVCGQDVVGRLGGDEFVIIQTNINGVENCSQLARRICDEITRPFSLGTNTLYPSVSIGISLYPDDTDSSGQVMKNADIAMNRAKGDSGASYRFFEHEMNDALIRLRRLSDDLREAINNDELVLFYQPIVNLKTGNIESVEALLRWHHGSYGYIPPHEIVAIADQFLLTKPLNEWVLTHACLQNRQWQAMGLAGLSVNVNISPAMYTQNDLVASVQKVLAETHLPPETLVLEVTEDTTMRDIDASPDIINRLREMGVKLALDDFGTGYSSLSHLRGMPVNKLKIDKSFVQDLNNVPKDFRFIRTIIQLANTLDLQVVAEGIEQQDHLRDLINEGCHFGQGYLFSRPMPARIIRKQLEHQLNNQDPFSILASWPEEPERDVRSVFS